MLKSKKAFFLILCCSTFCIDANELEIQKRGGTEFNTQISQNFDQISGQNNDSFSSGMAAVERLRKDQNKNMIVPESLVPLNAIFNELAYQVENDKNPDNIDIILLLDANGKTQTLALMYFLRELENALQNSANEKFPGCNLKLFSVIDSFVGEGGGAIPAAVCALGSMTVEEAIKIVNQIPSKILYPKSLYDCCGCCIGFRNFTKAAVSAYMDNPELIDEDNSEWISLYYDAFNPTRKYNECFQKLFGTSSFSDLKSSFETISLKRNPVISGTVSGAISDRDNEARSRVRRLGVTEILSTAESLLTDISDIKKEESKDMSSVIKSLGEFKILLHKVSDTKQATITDFRERIMKRVDIPRDTLIISIISDTCNSSVIIPTFNYSIKSCSNKKKIINLNYKITIPKYFYTPPKGERYDKSIYDTVRRIFLNEKGTNISKATEMFVKFLDKCNKRVLSEF